MKSRKGRPWTKEVQTELEEIPRTQKKISTIVEFREPGLENC